MSATSASTKRRRRWWLLALIVVVVAAAVAGGVWWFFGRDTTGAVRYLTATASRGTISQTVSTDFTLASDGGLSAVSLAGGSSTSSAASGTGASTTGATTSSLDTSAGATTYASFELGPSPTPSASVTTTATPTPKPTATTTPRPTPSGSGVPVPSSSQSAGGISGGSGLAASGGSSAASSSSGSATTSASVSSGLSGVVTHLFAKEGGSPVTLQRLLTVSGKGVFAFVSPTPLWKNLSTALSDGDQKVDVAVLQRALKDGGYYDGKVSGDFTSATKSAYRKWQADNGMSKTGVVNIERFVWMPRGATLTSWSVSVGNSVSGGTQLASISAPTALKAQALVSQGDLGELKVGLKAQMTIDGYADQAFTGTITAISDEPASSGSTGTSSSSGSTQYTITIRPQDLPSVARSGMTGSLDIVLQQHTGVLLVPTSAVTGTSSTSYVRVMENGSPVVRQVETGMATSAYTEITSGLTSGETVVTGTYTPGASTSTATSTTNRSGSLGGFLNGGAGGPPAGIPQGGFPGAGGGQ